MHECYAQSNGNVYRAITLSDATEKDATQRSIQITANQPA